jgi:hypothetical protein
MPRTKIDFSKTVLYKICCKDPTITDIYIGHTTNLANRIYKHKSICNNTDSKEYHLKRYEFIRENGGWDNFSLIVFETYPCSNVNEATAREDYWVMTLQSSLNSNRPQRSKKEYRQDNKEVLAEKAKEYRETNKEVIVEKKKQYHKANKEVIAEKAKEYYEANKEKMLEKTKKYYEANKEIIAEYHKQYQKDKKEEIAKKKKEYREVNKDIINEKAKERVRCEVCNCDVPRRHISTHNKNKSHLENYI